MMSDEIERLTNRKLFPRDANRHSMQNYDQEELLRELRFLAGYSTSHENPNSMNNKDADCYRALVSAGKLLRALIGWAIDHETGKAVKKRSGATGQVAAGALDFTFRNISANSHENEWLGSRYDARNARTNRQVVGRVLMALSREMKWQAGIEIAGALLSLDKGVVYDEVRPIKNGRKQNSIKLDNAQLIALKHVEYRNGRGVSLEEARQHVGTVYGISESTLKKWRDESDTRLPTVDPFVLIQHLKQARTVGKLITAIELNTPREKLEADLRALNTEMPEIRRKILTLSSRFSEAALAKDAAAYKTLKLI